MTKLTGMCTLVAFFGCAAATQRSIEMSGKGDPTHPLFVGYSRDGEMVVAATHADAMHGLAVAAADLGAPRDTDGRDLLICHKEMLTGTHVPTWNCRYPSEVERERMETQQLIDQPRNCTNCQRR